jgi:ATP-binding cassette subfamily B protein
MSARPPETEDDKATAVLPGDVGAARASAPPPPETDDEEDDDLDDEDDDEELSTFSASEAAGAFDTVYRFTWPFLRNYRKGYLIVGAGLLVETAFNVIMPLSLKFLIDEAFDEEDYHALYTILAVLGTAGIITSIVSIYYERWDARVSASVISDVRHRLFEHVQNLPAGFFARTRRGEILSRFSVDMAGYEESIKSLANTGLLPLMELVAGVALMFYLNWQLATVALLIFPITLIGPRFFTPKAVQANYDQKVNEASILGVVQENIAAQMVVKAFQLQRRALGWFRFRNDRARDSIASATFLTTMVERTVTISVLFLHLIVLAIGAYLATTGQISVGTFVTFESAFWEISYNVGHLMHYIPVTIQASAAVRHMNELLDEPARAADREGLPSLPRITNDITFERVGFHYEGSDTPVIDNFNLKIGLGKSVAIVGPSGSGKSTLLNLILRLYEPTEGRVTIDGIDIRKVTRDSLRANMAVVFQENMLFHMSVRENIRLGQENATDAEVEQAAKRAEIHRFIKSLPDGYDTVVGERGDTLSGGQRQRIAIARAIVRNPSVLLLDEATSALDQTTEAAINRTLLKVAKGRTMIFSTHRLTSVVEMDEIIVMHEGRVAERGTHEELLAKGGLYRQLWDDQGIRGSDEDDEDDDEE